MKTFSVAGDWKCEIPGQSALMTLPGTLDESGIGFPDDPRCQWQVEDVRRIGFYRDGDPIVTRLSRKATFEGQARIFRRVDWTPPAEGRVFLECARARHLRLFVNGTEMAPYRPGNLSTPYTFEITGRITGKDEFAFLSDNSYPGWPRNAIVYSSAASDETQTNWNGILGTVQLRMEAENFISDVRVYPHGDFVDVCVEADCRSLQRGRLRIHSSALEETEAELVLSSPGRQEIRIQGIRILSGAARWDLEEGNLHSLTVSCDGMEDRTVSFGLRDFCAGDGYLKMNGRRVFIRGEANCAVFPETGHMPMDEESWKDILMKYRAYGVNCMRFHSHCPPEAAFAAADRLGMLMQPELSHWDPRKAFGTEEARNYYRTELLEILRHLANHPSFVMLTLGNELHADAEGHAFMDSLLTEARAFDPTRLYANGSNTHYGRLGPDPASDFYTSSNCGGLLLRATSAGPKGWLNETYPDLRRNYDSGMEKLRQKSGQPVFSFEVGQYEILPDFEELQDFHGVTEPANLRHILGKVREAGLEKEWKKRVEASGELSLLCYRTEVEAALRTAGLSGISLLGIQDFPGQGTALVGMMNAHMNAKPYDFARPERFKAFFRDVLPLLLLPRFTWTAGETLTAELKIANYGKQSLRGIPEWVLSGPNGLLRGTLPEAEAAVGKLTSLGTISVTLPETGCAERRTLTVLFGDSRNEYPLWIYPDWSPIRPENIFECRRLDDKAEAVLAAGGIVYLAPDASAESLPGAVQAQFSTDFWSVCTFPNQAGTMGQMIDAGHPLFQRFPTETHTNWQWHAMASQPAMRVPARIRPLVTVLDSYAFLRPLAHLLECRCGGGRLMVSSMNLHHLLHLPEARALQRAIYEYMASEAFRPNQELSPGEIREMTGERKPG